jgi:hypothetical protein
MHLDAAVRASRLAGVITGEGNRWPGNIVRRPGNTEKAGV